MKTLKELKKQVSKKDKINLILFTLICVITVTFTMGYSALNQKLNISGEAAFRKEAIIRVTNLSEPTRINGGDITYNGMYGVNSVNLGVELPNKDSSVSYEVEITNLGNINQWIKSISATSNNENIVYMIDGIAAQKDIIYSSDVSDEYVKRFTITFSYKDSIKNGTEALPVGDAAKLSTIITFEFEVLETYLITYDLGGGTVSGNPINYTKATESFTLNNPTKKGHTFLGWTGSNGTTPQKTVQIISSLGGDKDYVANWLVNTYKLTINPNGGTYNGSSSVVTSDIIYNNNLTISEPSRIGYIFGGWTISNNDSTLSGTTFTMGEGDTTLTANWTPITYKINYNCNGGSGTTASSAHTYDVPISLTNNGCYKIITGTSGAIYKFLGWSTSSTATSAEYSNGQSVNNLTTTNGATLNLYAVWSSISIFTYNGSYNVLDDGNGNWRIKLLSNGTYTSNSSISIDAFLVGGGGGGGTGDIGGAGGGGGGGYTKTYKAVSITPSSYTITIGAGGGSDQNGSKTQAFGKEASGGNYGYKGSSGEAGAGGAGGGGGGEGNTIGADSGASGGKRGNNGGSIVSGGGKGQGYTTCEFELGNSSSCNSGVTNYASGGSGGSGKAVIGSSWGASTAGATPGAGAGGSGSAGGNAVANTGCGGGGGAQGALFGTTSYAGGKGASGIVVIRNQR